MLYRLLPSTILLFCVTVLWSQTPQNISLQSGAATGDFPEMACNDQFAGTISFNNFLGQSNDIDPDTIYLCFGDRIDVDHNGDADLSGDPNPATTPGITYGFFDCPPTTSGPNLSTILMDPCLLNDPMPINQIWVTAQGSLNGDITFSNTGTLQNTFNNGDPVLIWFAPLTIDNFSIKQYENDPVTMENGPCVNLNTDEAFAMVYLNEIDLNNFNNNTGMAGCGAEIEITGGVPEFDGSNYNVTIQLLGNPNVQGVVTSGPVTHGETMAFEVPTPGFYNITVEDGKSCGTSFIADMTACVSVTQSIQSGSVAPGDNICINITNESGFQDIVSMQYGITWDESVLQFDQITNLTPIMPNFSVVNSFNSLGDTLIFGWASLSGNGVDLPNGEVVYQICFNAVGFDGDCTDIAFIVPEGSAIEVVNQNGTELGFNGVPGEVCISNSALIVDLVQDSVSCPGATDGSFMATVSGGTPPYNVTWQNTAGGPVGGPGLINVDGGSVTANNLAAGTYSVTVEDNSATSLVSVRQVEVLGPPMLNILFFENPGPCNGDLGNISASLILDSSQVVNPTLNYAFEWSNDSTGVSISNLNSGNYSLTVTEIATGCTVSDGTFLPQALPLVVDIQIDSATCSGVGDGNIVIGVSGGTPNANGDYLIDLEGEFTGFSTSINSNGLASGSYPLTVTDNNGCTFERDIWMPAIKVLSITADIQNVNCGTDCSGSIAITGNTTGGVAATPYNFDWFGMPPPPPPTNTTATTSTLGNLCEGIYTVVMEDLNGCEIDTSFSIIEPTPLDVTLVDVQNESCQPGMDGSITIAVDGGTYPYTYTWNIPVTDSIATGLSAGSYTVSVEDADLCSDTLTIPVAAQVGPEILFLPDTTELDCSSSTNGSLTVQAQQGDSPIASYDWSNGDTGPTINGLSVDEYIVTVTDANSCTAVDTAVLTAPLPLVLDTVGYTLPQCPGSGGGSIALTMEGGTAPYFFNWEGGPSGVGVAVFAGLTAGNYFVTVIDANNCPPLELEFTLEDPPSIIADFSAIDSVSCANTGTACDGTATVSAMYSDGTPGIFDFTWTSSGESTTGSMLSTAVELCSGPQDVIISDGICNDTFTVAIPAPPPIVPGQDIENVSCFGLSDGEISLFPTGGTPPYNISWNLGQTGNFIDGLSAGTYTAVITDSKNCSFTHTVAVIEPDPFEIFLNTNNTNDVACPGGEDGVIAIGVQGGNLNLGAPTYLWENGVAPANSNQAEGLAPGEYSVTVIDQKGCSDTLTHTLVEPPPIQFRIPPISPIPCFNGNTFVTVDSVWGGNVTTYQFSVNNSAPRTLGDPYTVFPGEVTVTVIDVINNCEVDTTFSLTEPQELVIELPQVIVIELGDTTTRLDPVIPTGVPIDSFIWTPAAGLDCSDCKNPVVLVSENETYILTIIDINGCTATESVEIDIKKSRNVYIPNVFSPNGDGINDKFQVYTGPGVVNINLVKVYDRWGELMFEAEDLPPDPNPLIGWDGNFRGQEMNPGVFLYLIEVEFVDGQVILYKGDVTLVK